MPTLNLASQTPSPPHLARRLSVQLQWDQGAARSPSNPEMSRVRKRLARGMLAGHRLTGCLQEPMEDLH